jgi:peptidyl-prolyl cis-trans isomerase SurA
MLSISVVASPAEAKPKRRLLSRVVAIVDEQCITSAELEWRVQQALRGITLREPDPASRDERLRAVRRQALDQLIEKRLVVAEASRRGIEVSAAELEHALVTVQAQNGLDRAGLLEALREQGFDESTYRREVGAQLAEMKLVRAELERTEPGWAKLGEEAQLAAMTSAREKLVQRLRESRYVEVRL